MFVGYTDENLLWKCTQEIGKDTMMNKFGKTIEQEGECCCLNQTKLRSSIGIGREEEAIMRVYDQIPNMERINLFQ